jgi:hypothetical protein
VSVPSRPVAVVVIAGVLSRNRNACTRDAGAEPSKQSSRVSPSPSLAHGGPDARFARTRKIKAADRGRTCPGIYRSSSRGSRRTRECRRGKARAWGCGRPAGHHWCSGRWRTGDGSERHADADARAKCGMRGALPSGTDLSVPLARPRHRHRHRRTYQPRRAGRKASSLFSFPS